MRQTSPFTAEQTRALAYALQGVLAQDRFPVAVTADEAQEAMPAILRALGIEILKHACRNGRGPAYGKLAALGDCGRCDELRAGETARPRFDNA